MVLSPRLTSMVQHATCLEDVVQLHEDIEITYEVDCYTATLLTEAGDEVALGYGMTISAALSGLWLSVMQLRNTL